MRDPQGSIEFEEGKVLRRIYSPLIKEHFLYTQAARNMVIEGDLVDFSFADEVMILSPRVPFVSYPHEWTNAQLADAGELTLKISESLSEINWELKDASAWNVIFNGTKPTLCDHLSFQPIENQSWWAFAQFVRHFILPLCVSKYSGLNAMNCFKFNRDGLQPSDARPLIGAKRFLTRYWPLMIKSKATSPHKTEEGGRAYHKKLYALSAWYLKGVSPRQNKEGQWVNYYETRYHYSNSAQNIKYQTLSKWIEQLRPKWVIDFGCNRGDFSILACSKGAYTVAIDSDHDSIQRLYLSQRGNTMLFPIVANLDDLVGGRGWAEIEFPGLVSRLYSVGEMSLMLALIHHLAISNSIPYEKIAELAWKTTKKWLVIELIEENDPLVRLLCAQRMRQPAEFTIAKQRAALETYFLVMEEISLPDTGRHLLLLKARR
jgi:hypothetical protein